MHKQPKHYFEAILGVHAPWSIQEVVIDDKNKMIQIEITCIQEKSKFSFFTKNTDLSRENIVDTGITKRWMHTPLGCYSCHIISTFCFYSSESTSISRDSLSHPSFVGDAQRTYSHQLRQQVALANVRGLAAEAIAHLYRTEVSLVEEILRDVERMPEAYRLAACLPTEVDPIWERIITDKVLLKTQVFSLKLLLSKLKLSFFDTNNESAITGSINELRKFFIAQVSALEAEYNQICALDVKKVVVEERQASVNKLVLPGLKNGIWLKLISGKINLHSANVSLNLMLVRSRHAFNSSSDNQHRIVVLNSLREYFRKNARLLKAELVLINQLMNAPESNQYTLPDERHRIWNRILRDDTFIPSAHIAYKMLLSNLRSQMLMNPDPVVEINAARRVRDFIKHNQRFMQQEYTMVLKNSYA